MAADTGDGIPGFDPAALARAEAALDILSDQYLTWAEADLAALQAAMAELQATPADPARRARLFAIAHDIKGQAATFGYPLLSQLGERLCRLIEAEPATAPLARLVEAMAEVLARRLSGDGGAMGRELLARLDI